MVRFWMRNFKSPSMKPTMIITNQEALGALDLGPVPKSRKRRAKQTTKRYVDGKGRVRFVGTKSLKTSQSLSPTHRHF